MKFTLFKKFKKLKNYFEELVNPIKEYQKIIMY